MPFCIMTPFYFWYFKYILLHSLLTQHFSLRLLDPPQKKKKKRKKKPVLLHLMCVFMSFPPCQGANSKVL